MNHSSLISRRECLAALAASSVPARAAEPDKMIICAFSKHFQWTDVRGCAETCASLGYEGIDLTLRDGGHVLPERVEEDLPKAVEIIHQAGLKIPMVTSHIMDTGSRNCETVLKTLARLGIRKYRWGTFRYDLKASLPDQLAALKPKVKDLAAMNQHYGLCAMYHTHSGTGYVGASMWDLYWLLRDFDANYVSANYDVGHATVEGGFGGWIHSSRLLLPYIKGVAVKDFKWTQNARGAWVPGWCALGQGMVNFKDFFALLKSVRFSGPLQVHMEYPDLGGADTGKTTFTIPKDQLLTILKRDLDEVKAKVRAAGLA